MLLDFGKANLIEKALQQPERVKQVLQKAQTDGVFTTLDAVRSKLGQPLPLGYCNVGVVAQTGPGVTEFAEGDRVVSNGPHADIVHVPKTLCAKIPDAVDDVTASFTVVGAIGLQGIRLAKPTLGECFVVTGAGLIGLLSIQLLIESGCRVLAIDFDSRKLEIAASYGAQTCNPSKGEDPVQAGLAFSRGKGVDGVILTASTKSSDPVSHAAQMCRKRGRVILVGVTGLDLNRADFYDKEISFQVSCSYGPGRYDHTYEDLGQDYPYGYVRWTQQRNFEAILDMMAAGKLKTDQLATHQFDFLEALSAYDTLSTDKSALGIVLNYPTDQAFEPQKTVALTPAERSILETSDTVSLGVIGAGNYASRVLVPAFKTAGAGLHSIASSGGRSSVVHGRKAGFAFATSDTNSLFENDDINAIVIATRHNSHADLTVQALDAGKHVFVEKPLALNHADIDAIEQAATTANRHLMVGFNRRFAPHVQIMKGLLENRTEPSSFVMVMNAGHIPADHWTQDPDVGGGRIVGEACHYIDLMRYLAGAPICSVQAQCMGAQTGTGVRDDKVAIILGFENGSFGTIHYLANGASSFPKERIEVFNGGATLQLDNFRKLTGFGWPGFTSKRAMRQDKGQLNCAAAFMDAVKGTGPAPIAQADLFEVARVSVDIADALRTQRMYVRSSYA